MIHSKLWNFKNWKIILKIKDFSNSLFTINSNLVLETVETPQNGTSFQHQQQMAIEVDVQAEATALTAAEENATQNLVSFCLLKLFRNLIFLVVFRLVNHKFD